MWGVQGPPSPPYMCLPLALTPSSPAKPLAQFQSSFPCSNQGTAVFLTHREPPGCFYHVCISQPWNNWCLIINRSLCSGQQDGADEVCRTGPHAGLSTTQEQGLLRCDLTLHEHWCPDPSSLRVPCVSSLGSPYTGHKWSIISKCMPTPRLPCLYSWARCMRDCLWWDPACHPSSLISYSSPRCNTDPQSSPLLICLSSFQIWVGSHMPSWTFPLYQCGGFATIRRPGSLS